LAESESANQKANQKISESLKQMKKILLTAIGLIGVAGLASASNNFTYTATGTPGNTPDGVDQNSDPVNVWSLLVTPGSGTGSAQGAYEGTAFSGETLSGWQIWTSPGSTANGPGVSGSINASDTFAGGALSIGQTVSLNFEMRGTSVGTDVGVSLLNGSGNAITFGIFGGEPNAGNPYTGNGYFYTDAGSTYASAGSMGYQYQSEFNISFEITSADTYTAVAGSDVWSGTYSGSLTGIDVFNNSAGNASDVDFNNLTVATPEPSTWAMSMAGGLTLFGYLRKFRRV
jgi:hypothetical protein